MNKLKIVASIVSIITSVFTIIVTSNIIHETYHAIGATNIKAICYLGRLYTQQNASGWVDASTWVNLDELFIFRIQAVYVVIMVAVTSYLMLKAIWD